MRSNRRRFLGATTSAIAGAPIGAAAANAVANASTPLFPVRITSGLVFACRDLTERTRHRCW